jgi:hypothetical protein
MEALKENVLQLYYKNLEQYAKKNKIEINLPIKHTNIESNNMNNISSNFNTETENIYNEDDYIYKKPWNKLNIIHKSIKMKEFANNLDIEDAEIKKHLKNQLVLMIKNKKLTKKNEVNYDHINGHIISIPSLKYTNNKYNLDNI